MKNFKTLLPSLIMFAIFSCKKDEVVHTAAPFYFYVPVDTGRWIIYDVDSTYYDNFPPYISDIYHYTYQVIERIDSTFTDNAGRKTQRLVRARRDSASAPWMIYNTIWFSNLSYSGYEKVEENIRFVKLGFPITQTNSWNGNAYNFRGYDEYYYNGIHVPMSIASSFFDSTITVEHGLPPNVVEEKNGEESFANHIGMIYKKSTDIKFDTIPNHWSGSTFTYTIKNHGLHNAPMPIVK